MMRNREQKKRIKECLSQLKHLDSVYAAEIKKPEAEQDTDLLEECLETMSYLHDVVESLSRQTQIQRSGVGSRIVLRRVAIVAIALAVLLIGMSVAEAAGFRVWSALIHWDSRYLHVTYTTDDDISNPNMGDSIKSNSDESLSAEIVDGHEIICNSIEDAIELLGFHIMLPQNLPDEMAVQEIIYHEYATDPSQNNLSIRWGSNDGFIIYTVKPFTNSDSSISYAFLQEQNESYIQCINGIEFIVTSNLVLWIYGDVSYTMETNLEDYEIQTILASLTY